MFKSVIDRFVHHRAVRINLLHTRPDFTKNTYDVTRGHYSKLDEEHLKFFDNLLGPSRILTDLSDLEKYNVDWFRHLRGNSPIVLKPKTTQEVSTILSYCNDNLLAVCTQGGNTGAVGGCTPIFDEIVLSTELMNEIIHFDPDSSVLTCQSGCVLQNLNDYLAQHNVVFPLDLGSKGSCQIGGNVSTNAGGLRLLRYGNLHGNVLGVEAVTADGQVIDCMSSLKKDNTGYHLKHLFIGSEGTLGVVTKVAIQCKTRPKTLNVAFLGLQSYEKVRKTFGRAKQDLDEILTAFEVMDAPTMDLNRENLGLDSPIGEYPYYVLVETTGSDEEHDQVKMNRFLEMCLNKHLILNGTVTDEPTKCKAIWALREKIPEGFPKDGHVFMYDVSLPHEYYYQLVDDMRERMGTKAKRVFGFGHIADNNIHLHVSVEKRTKEITDLIEPYIFEKTKQYNGSISAEHGIGFLKAKYLPLMRQQPTIHLMKRLKQLMDPRAILNPYKTLP